MIAPEIIQGNCVDVMAAWPANHVDLIVADPPYNLGKEYGNGSDSLLKADYLAFTKNWLAQATRVLKPTGSLYVFMGFRFISHLYLLLEDEFRFRFGNWICWNYTQGMGRTCGFSPRHDDVLLFTKSDQFTFNLDDIRIPQKFYRSRNNMRGANPGDVWEFSHVHYCNENRTEHPTQKPEGLIERIVLASSNKNDLVVDPFAGSGTTLRVCQQLDRRSIGIEL
ncbi:MAG: site-specific DNA-methyltransferase, partial [Planctomycetaceae bacterium]